MMTPLALFVDSMLDNCLESCIETIPQPFVIGKPNLA